MCRTERLPILFIFILLWGCQSSQPEEETEIIPKDEIILNLLTPNKGIPGDTITLRGKNFPPSPKVNFGIHSAMIIESNKDKVVVIVPEKVDGNMEVTVSNNEKQSNAVIFNFQVMEKIELADPTLFFYKNMYYVYGTGGKGGNVDEGFLVYTSSDLRKWDGPEGVLQGFALKKSNTFGTWGFWAPQVFLYKGGIYMAYTANENIAIAKSDSPLGPFMQHSVLSGDTRQIDPYVFLDDDGKVYIYFVRLSGGNKIYVAQLKDDLSDIRPETLQLCLSASAGWEDTQNIAWKVVEGPTVLKYERKYYLFYSANHYENSDYAVGYAVSESPFGPWEKFEGNPILDRRLLGVNGTGHGDFIKDKDGNWLYVFHAHFNNSSVHPRLSAIIQGSFSKNNSSAFPEMIFKKETFKYLLLNK